MDCPRCRASLVASDDAGIEIDTCTGCRGTWLDAGELGNLLARVEPAGEGLPALAARDAGDEPPAASGGEMGCPRCPGSALEAFVYLGDSGIELDRCGSCGGLWLDGGERARIEELVARTRRQTEVDAERFTRDGAMRESPLWSWLEELGKSLMKNARSSSW